MIAGILVSLLSLALPVVLVVLAVRYLGARQGVRPADGRAVRRFFQYLVLYGLVLVAATGVAELLGRLVEPAPLVESEAALARALTFTLLGVPMVVGLAAWTRSRLRADPEEREALAWAAYLGLTALTTLVVAMVAVHDLLAAALAGDGLDGTSAASALVWGGVWWLHWWLADRHLTEARNELHLVLGCLIGLGTSVAGLARLLGGAVALLVLAPETGVLVGTDDGLARAAATLAAGAPVWILYWGRRLARTARPTTLWYAYVLPVGVGVSLVLSLVGASLALYQTLVWLLGDPEAGSAVRHFAGTPLALAVAVVGTLSWWYHRQVLASRAPEGRTEVLRVYEYLLAGIALLAAAAGVVLLVVAFIEAVVPVPGFEVGASVVNTLLAAVTLLLVGGPLWWVFWSRIERTARTSPVAETSSPTRRTYLLLLFGVGGVVAVVTVLATAYVVVEDALRGSLDGRTLLDARVPIGLLLATGTVSGYHWLVHRADRAVLPTARPRATLRRVLLVGPADDDLVAAVRHATGAQVELWVRTDGGVVPWSFEDVLRALGAVSAPTALVLAGTAGIETVAAEDLHQAR